MTWKGEYWLNPDNCDSCGLSRLGSNTRSDNSWFAQHTQHFRCDVGWSNGNSPRLAPSRSHDAEVDLFILRSMDGARSLEAVASQTAARFPTNLSFDSALARAHKVVEYYGCRMGSESKP